MALLNQGWQQPFTNVTGGTSKQDLHDNISI
jgi:hypothetical protein